ncbi:hypothetical protein GPALN_012620 [Globodera pallida]|nr:hypothetical protein GPALN_012620 [Globodera pallida]
MSPLSPKTLRFCLWTICSIGIVLNVLVFRKYRSYKCRKSASSAVRSSLQLLCVMAAADTLSLLALMLALGSHHLANRESSTILVASVCKLDTFLIHASSAFGIWCWLILSGLRYLAIHHPYAHLRLHREPMLILVCAAIGCCLLESWILFDVTYLEEARTCGETLPEELGKILQLVEILWTYFVPLSLIIVLDLKLLCCHSTRLLKRVEMPSGRFLAHSATLDSAWDVASGVGVPSPANSAALSRPPLRDFVLTPTFCHSTATLPTNHKSSIANRLSSTKFIHFGFISLEFRLIIVQQSSTSSTAAHSEALSVHFDHRPGDEPAQLPRPTLSQLGIERNARIGLPKQHIFVVPRLQSVAVLCSGIFKGKKMLRPVFLFNTFPQLTFFV